MRAFVWVVAALALAAGVTLTAGVAFAQDANPEQLKKLYDDALAQLKAAQDRKNELATQNEQLGAKVAALQKEVDSLRNEMTELKRRDAESAEQSFYLRSYHAAWQTFIDGYPELKARWKRFLESDLLSAEARLPEMTEPDWRLSTSDEVARPE
jgi:Skp family chaperone for outer membrane proteins